MGVTLNVRSSFLASLTLTSAVALTGCDLIQFMQNTVVVSGLVVATPRVEYPGYFDVPSEVVATAWVGQRDSVTATTEPQPVSGVAVSVGFDGTTVTLTEDPDQQGVYVARSKDNPVLTYEAGRTYSFDAIVTDTHGGETEAPTQLQPEAMTFEPAFGTHDFLPQLKTHPKDEPLVVSWDASSGTFSFVTVIRADPMTPDEPEVVFDTRPENAAQALKMLAQPATSVTIPGEHFAKDGLYAVVVFAADKGETRTNTFFGSPFLAGSGAAVLVTVGSFGL